MSDRPIQEIIAESRRRRRMREETCLAGPGTRRRVGVVRWVASSPHPAQPPRPRFSAPCPCPCPATLLDRGLGTECHHCLSLPPLAAMADTLAIVITAVHLTIDITKATFYFSLLLVVQLFQVIVFILSPFWAVISFVLLPLTHLIRVALSIILFPFRLRLLDKFEVLITPIRSMISS